MNGWIRMHRQVMDHEVFQDPTLFKVFSWCLLRAAHKETSFPVRTGRGITTVKLNPGQLIFGRHEAARFLRLSPSTTRRKIERLAYLQILTIKTDTHYSVITIVNWNSYQSEEPDEGQASGQATDRQRTHTRIKEEKIFIRPTIEEVTAYCLERSNGVDPKAWVDHYMAVGWKVGKTRMVDWKAAVRTWEKDGSGVRKTSW